jgi:hypothetical protein
MIEREFFIKFQISPAFACLVRVALRSSFPRYLLSVIDPAKEKNLGDVRHSLLRPGKKCRKL